MRPIPALGALVLGLLVASAASKAETIAAYGDSLTAMGDWFPWMPPEWTMLDYGENGDECYADVVSRLLADLATPGHPVVGADAVVIFCGTNDVRKVNYSEAQTLGEIEDGADAALALGIPVVIVAPPPVFADGLEPYTVYNERFAELRDAIASLALTLGPGVAWANAYDVFWDALVSGWTIEQLYFDLVHPSFDGRQFLAETIEPALVLVPEPSPPVLLIAGLAGLALARRKGPLA